MLVAADKGDPAERHKDVARRDILAQLPGGGPGGHQRCHRLDEDLSAVHAKSFAGGEDRRQGIGHPLFCQHVVDKLLHPLPQSVHGRAIGEHLQRGLGQASGLIPVGGLDQVVPRREAAIQRPDTDARLSGNRLQ